MPAKYVPGQGWVSSYEQEEEERGGLAAVGGSEFDGPMPRDMTAYDRYVWQQERARAQQAQQTLDAVPNEQAKPFVSGGTAKDVLQAFPNALVGIPTDIVDLGLGLVDTVDQAYRTLTDPDYNWNDDGEWFNDSNNPLTEWRRDTMGTSETYAGEFVSTGLRIASLFAPGGWLKLGTLPSKLGRISSIVNKAKKIPGVARAVQAARKPYQSAQLADKLTDIASAGQKASGITKAAKLAQKNSYLTQGYRAIAEIPEAASWWKKTTTTASAVVKTKINPRNLAETIAWDAFVGFNVYGEGVDDMDETIFDLAASMGVDVPLEMTTTIYDSAFDRKLKGMLDGGVIGTFGGALVDLFRIRRFAGAMKNATPQQRKELVKAFQAEAEELGTSVATMAEKRFARYGSANSPVQNALAQMEGKASRVDIPDPNFAMPGRGDLPEGMDPSVDPWKGGELVQLVDSVDLARTARQAELEEAAQGVTRSLDEAPSYPDDAPKGVDEKYRIDPVRVTVLGQSNIEPTVTPQTIRRAVQDAIDDGMPVQDVKESVRRLLPERRINQLDYLLEGKPELNAEGILPAADSIWVNEITRRGRNEGWIRVDPETYRYVFNRKIALDMDQGDAARGMAYGIDQSDEALRYEGWLKQQDPNNQANNVRPPDDEVQANLAQREANDAYDQWEEGQADPAVTDGRQQAAAAALEEADMQEEQLARMADAVTAEDPAADLIANALGIDVDQLPRAEVAKAEVGRGWEVISPEGEVLDRFTTKAQATKAADKENGRLMDELTRRAQQQLDDGADQTLELFSDRMLRDGELEGTLKLTAKQVEEFQRYPNLREFIDQFEEGKKTYRFSQSQMDELADGFKALLQTEGLPANRRKVLKNLAEKLDLEVKRLSPDVRARRTADQLIRDTNRYLTHGDYC